MTTELKACPFCGGKKHLIIDDYHDPEMDGYFGFNVICNAAGWEGVDKGCGVAGAWGETKEEAANIWNTRAVPDVPELVRYKPDSYDAPSISRMIKDEEGGYVSYDKVASLLAAERQRAEAAEADSKRLIKALKYIAHTFTEDSHGNMKCLPAPDYQAKARAALEGVGRG